MTNQINPTPEIITAINQTLPADWLIVRFDWGEWMMGVCRGEAAETILNLAHDVFPDGALTPELVPNGKGRKRGFYLVVGGRKVAYLHDPLTCPDCGRGQIMIEEHRNVKLAPDTDQEARRVCRVVAKEQGTMVINAADQAICDPNGVCLFATTEQALMVAAQDGYTHYETYGDLSESEYSINDRLTTPERFGGNRPQSTMEHI